MITGRRHGRNIARHEHLGNCDTHIVSFEEKRPDRASVPDAFPGSWSKEECILFAGEQGREPTLNF